MVNEEGSHKTIPVRVAVRIRPLNVRELREGCQDCLDITQGNPQVVVRGTDKAFTYDYAYPSDSSQYYIYETAVKNVVQNLFKGYNVTVLAYGQTGSGKTHTMGTAYSGQDLTNDELGIIPRALKDIFNGLDDHEDSEFMVKVSFIELYKETLFDLLSNRSRDECAVDIREDTRGGIKMVGLTEIRVQSLEETMRCLEQGAVNRATGATAMNAHSSRSHAIFSLHIEQHKGAKAGGGGVVSSKFHMVDLAGSERAKKTGATGERFKEGVNINKGLLALGNVISALCEDGNRGHIPYRDSKLTRLLQDSLGGNSHTVMLACVSPADSNLEETLSTLRYADRARKIKNKPIVNRDPQAAELADLRQKVVQLQIQLLAGGSVQGKVSTEGAGMSSLLARNKALEEENAQLNQALQTALDENTSMAEKALLAEMSRDRMKVKLEELCAQTGNTYESLNKTLNKTIENNPELEGQLNLVKELKNKVVEIQTEQSRGEKAMMDHELSRHIQNTSTEGVKGVDMESSTEEAEDTTEENIEAREFGTEFTLRQAKLNEELHDLNKALAMKQELMSKMTVNDAQFLVMKSKYEKEKRDMETQIELLCKEKDELMQKLKVIGGGGSNKVSEQRRKRVQELEQQINSMKQKQKEQLKLLKMKEQSELKVNKLNSEIQGMKATRVKLIRQMKEDNEKFREWKAKKDREVAKLKQQDRQKQYQIVKMEQLHSKQQNVLRRKMEEAVAINKRLKDAMAIQKAGAEKRAASRDVNSTQKIRSWLEGELNVVSVKKQAKQSLNNLLQDRKTISEQINKVKRKIQKEGRPEIVRQLKEERENLENELQMRTAQINDLQSTVIEDEDNVNRKRFESLQSMVEAKHALGYLFQVATDNNVQILSSESDLRDLQVQYDDLARSKEETELDLKNLKESHHSELTRVMRENEEKVLFFLNQMSTVKGSESLKGEGSNPVEGRPQEDAALLERLQFQEKEIAKLSSLHEQLQAKTQECDDLRKRLTVSMATGGHEVLPMPSLNRKTFVKAPKAVPKIAPKKHEEELDYHSLSEESEESDSEDHKDDDPDWSKTPLYKKVRKMTQGYRSDDEEKENKRKKRDSETKRDSENKLGTKRDSNGETKCGCKGDCSKRLCLCRKNATPCSSKCKCIEDKCTNKRDPDSPDTSADNTKESTDTVLNSTFDFSSPLRENVKKARIEPTGSFFD